MTTLLLILLILLLVVNIALFILIMNAIDTLNASVAKLTAAIDNMDTGTPDAPLLAAASAIDTQTARIPQKPAPPVPTPAPVAG